MLIPIRSFYRFPLMILAGSILAGGGLWVMGALWFDGPAYGMRIPLVMIYGAALTGILFWIPRWQRKIITLLALYGIVFLWWLTLRPSNSRQWQPDVAKTPYAEFQGDDITLHNVRNFDNRTEADYAERWETRTVRLSHITGIDIILTYWGSPWIAHPIISFLFSEGNPLAISIETRKEAGETYSTLGGLYRRYELIYIIADERDVIRLRTNYRSGEDSYLYHTTATPERSREIFLDYLQRANQLNLHPEFYNALTSNCTTNIRIHTVHAAHGQAARWDWRLLANGKSDEFAYEHGGLDRTYPFDELKKRSLIKEKALAADQDPHFSSRIREGLPGFLLQQ